MRAAVVTRDSDLARAYAVALAPFDLFVIPTPVTCVATAEPADQLALVAACARTDLDAVLVASARAVAPLIAAGGPGRAHVVAVGAATAAALAGLGVDAEVAAGTAVAAADRLIARGVRRVLVPRAADGRDDALERLRAAGVEAIAVTAYRTIARTIDDPALGLGLAALRGHRAAVLALFAPSQVAALAALVDAAALAAPIIAAIGATTAAALTDLGVRVDAVAASPDPAAMARALAAVYPPR
jgi:uroporphyrinogen-III synthase